MLHPFREGNGRSIREFIGQLARDAGYGVDWQEIDRAAMTRASIEAYEGDSSRMASLILSGLRDLDREFALDLARAVLGDDAQPFLAVQGQTYDGMVVGSTERYILQELTDRGGEVVLHSRTALVNAQLAVPGQAVEIRYPHGRVGLVEKAVDGPKHEFARQRENSREIDR